MINKLAYLAKATKITEEWSRGGSPGNPATILEDVYRKFLELAEEAER